MQGSHWESWETCSLTPVLLHGGGVGGTGHTWISDLSHTQLLGVQGQADGGLRRG